MKNNEFSYCPDCGSTDIETADGSRKWKCPKCGLTLYNNVAAAVGIVVRNEHGEILLEQRAKEPRKGYLAFPGGFVDPDESLETAAQRECREELGMKISNLKYVASYPNTYEYKNIVYKTCDVFFEGTVAPGTSLNPEKSEVSQICWVKCSTMEDIEKIPFAFNSAIMTMKTILSREGK